MEWTLGQGSVEASGTTEHQGQAEFQGLLELGIPKEPAAWEIFPMNSRVRLIRAKVASGEPVYVQLDAAHMEARGCQLRLPPTGRVRVKVIGADGQPVRDPDEVSIRLVHPDEGVDPSLAFKQERFIELTDEDGYALFSNVGTLVQFEASAVRPGSSGASVSDRSQLVAFGEELLLVVDMAKAHPVLEFRAVDENGKPLANTQLSFERCGTTFDASRAGQSEQEQHGLRWLF
jgi:hypothetical protein